MARLPLLVLGLLSLAVQPAFAQIARFYDVTEIEGSFGGDRTSILTYPDGSRMTFHTTIGGAQVHLSATDRPGEWKGTAEANQSGKVESIMKGNSCVGTWEGHVSGTARLHLILNKSAYQLDVKLPDVPQTWKCTNGSGPPHPGKGGWGSVEMFAQLPSEGLELASTDTQTATYPSTEVKTFTTWKLKGVAGDLVAVPRAQPVTRGERTHLDGTASRRKERIQSYEWKLEPTGDCPAGTPHASFASAEVDVLLLCSMKATLVVSDGARKSEPASVQATVRPRDWHTKPEPPIGPSKIPGKGLALNHMLFGEQICAVEGEDADPAGHVIHRAEGPGATWEGHAYQIAAVDDATSPFHGWHWISKQSIRYARRIRLNRELYPGSTTGQENLDHAGDLAKILSCTERHEREHDRQMASRLTGKSDPAPKIERLIVKDAGGLRDEADGVIRELQTQFAAARFFENEVHAALARTNCAGSATIDIENADGVFPAKPTTFPNVANLGEGDAGGVK